MVLRKSFGSEKGLIRCKVRYYAGRTMKIAVIGGGNIGTLMAAELANKGHIVTVHTSRADCWKKQIEVFDAKDNFLLEGNIQCVTGDIKQAVDDADMILITVPAQTFQSVSRKLFPYVKKGQYIGVIPGSGGAEFAFKPLIEKGCIFFGLQRVHSIARLKERGKSVYMLGRKKRLEIGSIPREQSFEVAVMLEGMFDMPCIALPNYLSVTLTPSNPILHTVRLYSMFKDYDVGKTYERNLLFYEEWNDESSEMLISCDGELQALCDSIPLDLSSVRSLCDYYESYTPQNMTKKIRGIEAFKGLMSPMKCIGNTWVPDFESRYFTADFSYGLKVIKDLCDLFGVKASNIELIWKWYQEAVLEDLEEVFKLDLGKEELLGLY